MSTFNSFAPLPLQKFISYVCYYCGLNYLDAPADIEDVQYGVCTNPDCQEAYKNLCNLGD